MEGGYSSGKPHTDHPAWDNFALSGVASVARHSCYNAPLPWGRERVLIKLFVRCIGFALALLVFTGAVRAEMVRDMYSAGVSVADQSSAELVRASRLGLSEVLVKVCGSVEVLGNPLVKEALGGARDRLQRYAYSRDADAQGSLLVTMLFDSAYVTQLVIEAGLPLWTANRPLVLLWLVQEDSGGRQYVNVETAPALVTSLRGEFSRRGVPLQLPLYDLADTAALSPNQAWSLDGAGLLAASARYNLENVLAGRFARLSTGKVAGEWVYLREDERITRSVTAENEEGFLREGAALVAEAMAARYAVAATANDGGLTMSVSGVTDYADYAAIVAWLEGLELVERANIEKIEGDAILLRLQAQADAAQLATIIELNKRLVQLPDVISGPARTAELNYQWQK